MRRPKGHFGTNLILMSSSGEVQAANLPPIKIGRESPPYNLQLMDLIGSVQAAIDRDKLLRPGERLVVGVSGGPDSLCLLDCLHRLKFRPIVAHFDHAIRPESADEALRVKTLAESWGLPAELGRADVPAARGSRGSLEEVARRLRYRFLADTAVRHGVQVVATAHTADDQVETVLMHLLRGAGPSGLRGMLPYTQLTEWVGVPEAAGLRLVRPLLATWRSEIEAHGSMRGLNPINDPSNLDLRHFRNRLRHELLPILEGYNPGVRQSLFRTAQIMAAERELLEGLVDAAWPTAVRQAGPGCLALERQALLQEPLAVQRGILRRAVHRLRPDLRDVGFEAVDSALRFVVDPAARRQTLVGGVDLIGLDQEVVLRLPDAVIHFPWFPQLRSPDPQRLSIPGSLELAEGWGLQLQRVDVSPEGLAALLGGDQRREASIDPLRLEGSLIVRPPLPGDRIRPIGMQGSVKLADLFVHRSVPWPARARWPVLADDRSVIWVAGLHLSRQHGLTPESSQAVTMRLMVEHRGHARWAQSKG